MSNIFKLFRINFKNHEQFTKFGFKQILKKKSICITVFMFIYEYLFVFEIFMFLCNGFCFVFLGFIPRMSAITHIVSRDEWGAKPPKLVEKFNGPAPFVIIHHSYLPAACYTTPECILAMQSMQEFHQIGRGWNDIGYSFAIGGDGQIYYGRGFNVVGAHAPKYNDKSVGICLIGDWRSKLKTLFCT